MAKTKKSDVYACIRDFMLENQYPPTYNEICDGVGLQSRSSVLSHIHKLSDEGLIRFDSYNPRSIRVYGIEYRDIEKMLAQIRQLKDKAHDVTFNNPNFYSGFTSALMAVENIILEKGGK